MAPRTAQLSLAAFCLTVIFTASGCTGKSGETASTSSGRDEASASQPATPGAKPEITPGPPAPVPTPQLTGKDAELWERALKLHREAIVIDTHNDVTSAILDNGFDLGESGITADGKIKTHTDLKRLKEGGVDAQFFAVYVGKEFVGKKPEEGGGAARRAMDMIGVVYDQVQKHPDALEMAFTADDIRRIAKKGKIAALMGIEGGHAIEDSLYALQNFYRLGIRYMTLTHTNTNNWADSEADLNNKAVRHHNGLTDFGKTVVFEMNRLGMMVDISHVADKTFFDVIEVTKAPVIASHSSARALANHTRNLTDEQLKAVAKNGGVVMVNFYDGFIDPRKAELTLKSRATEDELKQKYPNDPKRVDEEMKKWRAANPSPGKTPLSVLIDHFDHIIKVAGIDHVGLGADLDGIPLDAAPVGMEDVSKYPVITYELLKRSYSEADVRKVLGENLLRVMAHCEQVAMELAKSTDKFQKRVLELHNAQKPQAASAATTKK
ncbi:MAG TPA: dipeptidase [Blastocatellia bacterium]|nr:dipeptidase [Blastocatellia bacterium]